MQLGNAGSLSAGVQYYWQDEYYSRIFNGVTDTIEEWDVWNATLRFTPEQGNWYVELWGRNLGDDDFVTGQYRIDASSGLGTNQFLLDPRTYSVTLDYAF
jgi:iron complex outermembrane receptor protein